MIYGLKPSTAESAIPSTEESNSFFRFGLGKEIVPLVFETEAVSFVISELRKVSQMRFTAFVEVVRQKETFV